MQSYKKVQEEEVEVEQKERSTDTTAPAVLFDLIDVSATPAPHADDDHNIISTPYFHETFLSKARSILTEIHTDEFVSSIEAMCRTSRQRRIEDGGKYSEHLGFIGYLDHDTFLTTESYDICLRATASWMHCAESVIITKDYESIATAASSSSAAMALTRPPRHHATKTLSNGFCLFNFATAAAVHPLSLPNCNKVSIIDWDVHYGQGVADIVSSYPNIRYVSIMHQVPAFPYLGQKKGVVGVHKNIMTIPIAADSSWACGYKSVFTESLLPFCYNEGEWEADLVIICAGYDALLSSDELANCNLTVEDYGKMTTLLRAHIGHDNNNQNEQKKTVGLMFGLEGGYQLRDDVPGGNLADAVLETIKAASY